MRKVISRDTPYRENATAATAAAAPTKTRMSRAGWAPDVTTAEGPVVVPVPVPVGPEIVGRVQVCEPLPGGVKVTVPVPTGAEPSQGMEVEQGWVVVRVVHSVVDESHGGGGTRVQVVSVVEVVVGSSEGQGVVGEMG